MGTFRGYGGFVGINPYRELPKEVSPEIVGETVIDLLTQSGSTGFHIKNIEVYRADTADEETVRIREQFFANIKSSAAAARRFVTAEVSTTDRKKSWTVIKFEYDPKRKTLTPSMEKQVLIAKGAGALGLTLIDLLVDKKEREKGEEKTRKGVRLGLLEKSSGTVHRND
jgi:hypothetical protein